jgi:flagellar hook assembly protein FlgD
VNEEDATAEVPTVFTLFQNTPNPFNPATAIPFSLSRPERVRLTVYDALGRAVAVLASGSFAAGSHTVRWDGRDTRGNAVSSGVYLYRLDAGGKAETRKMLLAR